MNIVLLGFMGTGKSVVGKLIARRLKMQYLDIDEEIEKEENMTISQVFSQFGEEYFRSKESEVVSKISEKESLVISAGGGVVLKPGNLENLAKKGILFCLDASPEVIFERTHHYTHRPLLQTSEPLKAIQELLKQREKNYAQIENHIDTSYLSPEEVAKRVIVIYKVQREKK